MIIYTQNKNGKNNNNNNKMIIVTQTIESLWKLKTKGKKKHKSHEQGYFCNLELHLEW